MNDVTARPILAQNLNRLGHFFIRKCPDGHDCPPSLSKVIADFWHWRAAKSSGGGGC